MQLTPSWPILHRNLAKNPNFYSQQWMRSVLVHLLKDRLVDRMAGTNTPKPEYVKERYLEELMIGRAR